ncbi:hypothetical protein I3760_13G097500 [Carya illinoinensis]|nr:hypothetical protein I3760_13G097500 [Carya illinoinensis]
MLSSLSVDSSSTLAAYSQSELQKFGVTDDLCEFVKRLTAITFRNSPMQDELVEIGVKDAVEAEASDGATTASNMRKDLLEWQEKHATVVLTTVKVAWLFVLGFQIDNWLLGFQVLLI